MRQEAEWDNELMIERRSLGVMAWIGVAGWQEAVKEIISDY